MRQPRPWVCNQTSFETDCHDHILQTKEKLIRFWSTNATRLSNSPCKPYFPKPNIHHRDRCPIQYHLHKRILASRIELLNVSSRCQSISKKLSHWTVSHSGSSRKASDFGTMFRPSRLYRKFQVQTVVMRWKIHYRNQLSIARIRSDPTSLQIDISEKHVFRFEAVIWSVNFLFSLRILVSPE